jgi:hypothetical protein
LLLLWPSNHRRIHIGTQFGDKTLGFNPQWSDGGVRLNIINIIVPTALDKNPVRQFSLSSIPNYP